MFIRLSVQLIEHFYQRLQQCFQNFLARGPFWYRKITTDSHILAHVNTECPDGRYPKLKINISEIILVDTDKYRRQAVAQLVEALCYKPEGRGFDYHWCHWNFSLT